IFGFKGKFESRQDKLSFILESVVEPESLEPQALREAHMVLVKNLCTQTALRAIVDTCITYQGNCSLSIHLLEDEASEEEVSEENTDPTGEETVIKAGREFSVAYSEDFMASLREHQAVSDIWFN
ncbi:MAG TPA: hypothetical protein VKZ39_05630, partial [Sphaerochaetaceae bacterium]|nr:hypothetical protein [Sphaerochaetaceae bacterium]